MNYGLTKMYHFKIIGGNNMIEITIIVGALALCKKVYPYFAALFGEMK